MEHGQNNCCWDDRDVPRPESYCADHDWQRGKPSDALTAVAPYPRFAGVAPPERARRTAVAARQHLLRPGGEYPLQSGFGWTNEVVLKLFEAYPEMEEATGVAGRREKATPQTVP